MKTPEDEEFERIEAESGWRKRQIALDQKADNARELGLAQHERSWFTIAELNAWADKKLAENPHWVMPTEEPERKEALAKQEQDEPVAYLSNKRQRINIEIKPQAFVEIPTVTDWEMPLYMKPPQRTWVGLTMQDVKVIEDNAPSIQMAIFMAEATLKDKNHGNS